jgi:small-conductance mechanosensitive channel
MVTNNKFRAMPTCVAILLSILLSMTRVAAAQTDWSGEWQTHWQGGGARIELKQQGDKVTGTCALLDGRLEGVSAGSQLKGTWFEGDRSGAFEFFMGSDKNSFAGHDPTRGWWTGQRDKEAEVARAVELDSPRAAFMSFVRAADMARMGSDEAWGLACQAVEFDAASLPPSRLMAIDRVRAYFEVVDLTTFRAYAIPEVSTAPEITFSLAQPQSGVETSVTLRRNAEGKWHLVVPEDETVAADRKALLAVYGERATVAPNHRLLQNPRDTMRAFLEGMSNWDNGGSALAISTLDLSAYPESRRQLDSATAAGYLRRVLDRIGMMGLQSIPNDGSTREPYRHFEHAAGSIVIAPASNAPGAPWLFTVETIATLPDLYFATDDLPPPAVVPPGMIPETNYFRLREFVRQQLPSLLMRVGHLELWQFLGVVACFTLLVPVGRVAARVFSRGVSWIVGPGWTPPRWFLWYLTFLFVAAGMSFLPRQLGTPERLAQYATPVIGSAVILLAGSVVWYLLTLFGDIWVARASATESKGDDIAASLCIACSRIATMVGVLLGISFLLGIPTTGMIAGLGIGGLAFAYASRETLANLFGAGTLVTDRPFRTGEWIEIGDVRGSVERVGIRSTRIRTAHDSVVIVPNGKLTDSTINNLGTRRRRLIEIKVTLAEGVSAERIEAFIRGVREAMDREPMFIPANTDIGMVAISPMGAEVSIVGSIQARTDRAELEASHKLLLEITRIAQANQLSLGKWMERPSAETPAERG